MAGDKVEMNVNNFYESYDHEQDQPLSAEDVVGSIIETLTGGEGGFEGGESHNTDLVDNMFSPTNFSAFDDIVQNTTNETKPRAYLNYILFDEGMHIIESQCGSFQANGDGTWQTIGTTAPMEIKVNGYLAVYINNASQITGCVSCSDVFFDQLLVRFTKGNLKEENHYYPHGLPIVALGSQASGFKDNKYKYQSNEYNKEQGLNWMNFHARQYDPQIGRFLSVDPLAAGYGQQGFSPYAAMGNAPESLIDPNGELFYLHAAHDQGWKYLNALGALYGLSFDWDEKTGQVTIKDNLQKLGEQATQSGMASGNSGASGSFAQGFAQATIEWFRQMVGDPNVKVHGVVQNNSAMLFSEDFGTKNNDDDFGATNTGNLSVLQDIMNGVNLSYRPDYDGKITREEANTWYKNNQGLPLYADLSKVDLKYVRADNFKKIGQEKSIQTFLISDDGNIYGHLTLKYLGGTKVWAKYDDYNFEMHPWNTPKNWLRNAATIYGAPSSGRGFRIFFYGMGDIDQVYPSKRIK